MEMNETYLSIYEKYFKTKMIDWQCFELLRIPLMDRIQLKQIIMERTDAYIVLR